MAPPEPKRPVAGEMAAVASRQKPSARARLRTYFLTGLVVAGPLAITLYITWWFIRLIDGWVRPLVPAAYSPETYLPFPIPGFGLVIVFTGLTLLGFLTANLVGRTFIDLGEHILARMPLVSGLYKGVKQVFETIFSAEGTSFRKVGMVEFPVKGTWSVVFLSAPASPDVEERLPPAGDYVGVFLPCTPNPTTGFFFYLPRRDVVELSMNVDDAAKLVMSAGVIQPEETQRRLQALAEQARMAEAAEPSRISEPSSP